MTQFALTERLRRVRFAVGSSALLSALFTAPTADAQLIAVKTLPIADANQFAFFPSLRSGMGGVSIAIADSLHDPFVNPATGARLRQPLFFSAPTVFSVSGDAGRGSTFPLGAIGRSGASFGGVAVAIQSINDAQPFSAVGPLHGADDARSNRYGFLTLGHTFAASRLTVGASALWSELETIDGTSLLYAGSRSVSQAGRAADVRLGMLKEWNDGHSLEALVFKHRIRMKHDVTYGDLYWDPVARQTIIRDRMVHGRDHTSTWGMQLDYMRPIGDSGWRAGFTLTANRSATPNRPAYDFETIAGSRGRSSAFNVGVGVARSLGATTVAADAIYEPIWSRIWGVSDTAAATNAPAVPNETIDSRLRFSNAILRTGVSHDLTLARDSKLQLQFGIQAHSIYYKVAEHDPVNRSTRAGNVSWMEWTRGWGATLRRASVEFHYRGRKTSGASRPGTDPVFSPGPILAAAPRAFDSIVPVPETTTALRNASVMIHQLSISLRVR